MHVVHLVSSGQLGGTEASLLEIIESLRRAHPDWAFRVVAPEDGPLVQRLAAMGVPIDVLAFPPALAQAGEAGRVASFSGRLRLGADLLRAAAGVWRYRERLMSQLVEHGAIDVVHAHGFKMQVLAALAAPVGTLLVWHVHDYVSSRPFSARLLRCLASRCALVVANSWSVAEDARRVLGTGARVETVYNAIDLARFTPDGPVLDLDRLGGADPPPAGTIRIGLLGAFGRWKGHRTFLRAVSALRDISIRAYVIGGAQYQTRGSQETLDGLRGVSRELDLDARVVFTGPVKDAAAALRALDIVVHASTEPEPFGMVIAEAMACGRPVIVSRAGGAAELVEDGVDGVGHSPGDAAQLAERLRALVLDPALRQRLGAAARQSAVRRFDRNRLAVQIGPLYEISKTA